MPDKRDNLPIPTKQKNDQKKEEQRKKLRRMFEVYYLGWIARSQRLNSIAPPPYSEASERNLWKQGWYDRGEFERKELEDSEIFRDLLVKETSA